MRRFRILFIDDEKVIRESFLKLVDWEEHLFDVAGVYKDGETAWEYLRENPVDIIVTDINMPFMDGIDLLGLVRKKSPKTRVILLTGYEYFEYAQKAIQLKAFDFLLKPVTTERLYHAVTTAACDIEREEAAEAAVEKNLKISQRYFISQLLYGKIMQKEIKKKAGELLIPTEANCYLVLVAAADALEGGRISEEEMEEIEDKLRREAASQMNPKGRQPGEGGCAYFGKTAGNYVQMLLVAETSRALLEDSVKCLTEALLEMTGKEKEKESDGRSGYCLTLAVGKSRGRMEEIPDSFRNVMHTLSNRHILGIGRVIYAADIAAPKKTADKIVLPTDTFLSHIRMGMTEEVELDIKKLYSQFRHKEYLSLESARMVTTELAITAFKGEVSSKDESVSYLYYLNHIQQLNTMDEMEADITQLAVRIAAQRKKGGNHKKKIAERALEYIRENYGKEALSLRDVADALNISIPYLAVLFKQETDKNFSAHLLQCRMEKAEELLRTTGLTICEISDRVGYSSAQYFAVCFKKYTGLSPGAYRSRE